MSSVTLVHPAKATAQNQMLFGRDTLGVPNNTVLDRSPSPAMGNPQFTAMPPTALIGPHSPHVTSNAI